MEHLPVKSHHLHWYGLMLRWILECISRVQARLKERLHPYSGHEKTRSMVWTSRMWRLKWTTFLATYEQWGQGSGFIRWLRCTLDEKIIKTRGFIIIKTRPLDPGVRRNVQFWHLRQIQESQNYHYVQTYKNLEEYRGPRQNSVLTVFFILLLCYTFPQKFNQIGLKLPKFFISGWLGWV